LNSKYLGFAGLKSALDCFVVFYRSATFFAD